MNVYDAKSYRAFVQACLADARSAGRKGIARQVATQLRCHSTYVSQVCKGRADFSLDQALDFAAYFKLAAEQAEFFLDLLHRDRAATAAARAHYQDRLDRRLAEQSDMKKRWRLAETLTAEQESKYYGSWVPQAVHLYCQLPGRHSAASVATALGLGEARVASVVADLTALGFIEATSAGLKSLRESVHLGTDPSLIARNHVNWRLKTITDLTVQGRAPGRHYSSVVSMSPATAREIEALIMAHVEATRELIIPSPAERLYVYCLDFFGL